MRRDAALRSLLAGLAVMAVAQLAAPLGSPPLYDGVVVQDPYRYLAPGPGQLGSPTSFMATPTIAGSTSPQFVGATTESPPQAQLVVQPGSFVLPAGITALTVSIEPVAAPASPSSGPIAGNVYRFSVADQASAALAINPGILPTLVLRAPNGVVDATIARFSGGVWQELPTQPSSQPGIFLTNVTALGDFALIAAPAPGLFGLGTAAVAGLIFAILLGLILSRRQRQPTVVGGSSPQRRTEPPKRRSNRRRRGRSR